MTKQKLQVRRFVAVLIIIFISLFLIIRHDDMWQINQSPAINDLNSRSLAQVALESLEVKVKSSKTEYSRDQFGNGWASHMGCDTRNIILHRDMIDVVINDDCKVISGKLNDPYTGNMIEFSRGPKTSDDIQIDHVVALSNAWQTGAQDLTPEERKSLSNDPLELLAVDGPANQQKSDGDASMWLPPNKSFRCQYVARQIAIKKKYKLWVTQAEKETISKILSICPNQALP